MTTPSVRDGADPRRDYFAKATVVIPDGETTHYEFGDEGQILVNVQMHAYHQFVRAELRGGDVSGGGIWHIPPVGTEVVIGFDRGVFEGDAYLVASVGRVAGVPVSPGVLVIRGPVQVIVESPDVEIRRVGGSASILAKLSDVEALVDAFNSHVHNGAFAGSTSPPLTPADPPSGTEVLKGQ